MVFNRLANRRKSSGQIEIPRFILSNSAASSAGIAPRLVPSDMTFRYVRVSTQVRRFDTASKKSAPSPGMPKAKARFEKSRSTTTSYNIGFKQLSNQGVGAIRR